MKKKEKLKGVVNLNNIEINGSEIIISAPIFPENPQPSNGWVTTCYLVQYWTYGGDSMYKGKEDTKWVGPKPLQSVTTYNLK